MKLKRSFAAALVLAGTFLLAAAPSVAAAEPATSCGGSYGINKKFWQTRSPSLVSVLGHLPADKRKVSGNILSLDYGRDASGKLIHQYEFDRHWRHIFGTSTTTGYGEKLQGAWAPAASTSWGAPAKINRRNLSECVVDGTDPAICLGIPSGGINVSSLGHHSTWSIIDPASLKGSAGSKVCITYDVMFSSNFDFRAIDGKLPGLTDAFNVPAPPDHLCAGATRITNDGSVFATRLGFTDAGAPSTVAALKLGNNFKNDMFSYDCTADGNSTSNEYLTQMHAYDPSGDTQLIQRGVWYRFEHELILNPKFDSSPGTRSGAASRIWLYRGSDNQLLRTFGREDSFTFDANHDGIAESYPLMPRNSRSQRTAGLFLSVQQGGNLRGPGPWELDHVIALRDFRLYLN
ncbi:hypothetical protein [Geminicoccus roseus]|uniref:hypothetical protein n=1 Tax=Geminicoccus roseus TaxID=404900 RepID=UPI0003FFBAF8|nr:hypothetical protein [Geminicoccus roseus]